MNRDEFLEAVASRLTSWEFVPSNSVVVDATLKVAAEFVRHRIEMAVKYDADPHAVSALQVILEEIEALARSRPAAEKESK